MQFSLESPSSLSRKLTITVDATQIASAYKSKVSELLPQVKLDGFRPGKVPARVVEQRYGKGIKEQVAQDLIKENLLKVLQESELNPIGTPEIESGSIELDKDFEFTAIFEVYPEITFNELTDEEVEKVVAEVTDQDVDDMITKLREHSPDWSETDRKAQEKDRATIDFEGSIDGELFDGGKAEGFALVLGEGQMIPGFESQIIGMSLSEVRDITVTFPEQYQEASLAGKEAVFKITLQKLEEPQLPEIDEAFAKRYNVSEGTVEAFYRSVRANMERELAKALRNDNRVAVFEAIARKNPIDIPEAMIDNEIKILQQDLVKSVFGDKEVDISKIPNLDRERFVESAKRRVHVGLLFAEYIKVNKIKPDDTLVDEKIKKLAQSYEDPQAFIDLYQRDAEKRQEIENDVIEDMAVEMMLSHASVKALNKTYNQVMNPDQPQVQEDETESENKEQSDAK